MRQGRQKLVFQSPSRFRRGMSALFGIERPAQLLFRSRALDRDGGQMSGALHPLTPITVESFGLAIVESYRPQYPAPPMVTAGKNRLCATGGQVKASRNLAVVSPAQVV